MSLEITVLVLLLVFYGVDSYNLAFYKKTVHKKFHSLRSELSVGDGQSDEPQYTFLDCGRGKRLERFGPILVSRSCPAAVWSTGLNAEEWSKAKLSFDTGRPAASGQKKTANRGQWSGLESLTEDWRVFFKAPGISFRLSASENGQARLMPCTIENETGRCVPRYWLVVIL